MAPRPAQRQLGASAQKFGHPGLTPRSARRAGVVALASLALWTAGCAPGLQARQVQPGGPGGAAALDESPVGREQWRRSPLAVGERAALATVDDDAALDADHGGDQATYRRGNLISIDPKMVQRCKQVRAPIERAGLRNGIDPLLLLAIAWVESGFNSGLESSAGARGIMQLIPSTAAALGCRDTADVTCSAEAAAVYVGRLLRRYNGDLVYALCAYNAGHVRPTRAWRRGELPANLGFATRVLEARSRLERNGCDGK